MLYSQYFLLLRCLYLLGDFLKTYMCNISTCYVYICIAFFLRKFRNYLLQVNCRINLVWVLLRSGAIGWR